MTTPSIAILCVTHARPALLRLCLESCVRQDYPNLEILVVANPADPASESVIRETAPAAKILCTHRNLGFFPALNIALANTSAEYVMIVDDDAWFLNNDALRELMAQFTSEPSLGAVTCNLEGPTETPIIGGDRYIRVFTTGFTMMPRKMFTEWVDYFPDVFFRSAGESFICTQLWEQGRPVKRVERVRMHHALAMQGRSVPDWYFYSLRSEILCAVMREPGIILAPVLASKFLKSFLYFALKKRRPILWAHAWFSAAANLSQGLLFRRPISVRTRLMLNYLGNHVVHDLASLPGWRGWR